MKKKHKIDVLFLNHTATIGGAEKSFLDILTYINKEKFRPLFVCFEEGPLVEKAKKISGVQVKVIPFPEKVLKYNRDKKGLSQLVSPLYLLWPMLKLLLFTMRSNADVVYTNSMKAHFVGLLVGKLSFKKVIWHVRDILDDGLNKKLFVALSHRVDQIICISKAVSKQFTSEKVEVVYNGMLPIEEIQAYEGA
ncbi:glycosyltransferase [Evansella sp. AB-rgal1]|uniref:glycosyltransferase n=1 Tax=Evansella sp. AB-rgal1 TaxID=3242696 RepID=UPI00359ED1D4